MVDTNTTFLDAFRVLEPRLLSRRSVSLCFFKTRSFIWCVFFSYITRAILLLFSRFGEKSLIFSASVW